jgi:hypothetical protein
LINFAHPIVGTVDGRIVFRLPLLNFGFDFLGGQPPFKHSILGLQMNQFEKRNIMQLIKISPPPIPPPSISIVEFVLGGSFF